jgi:uncharacterized LabA/DUF88 family protein
MSPYHQDQKRTIVYVDGYNLYYGRLTGTTYKWLDLPALFLNILKAQDPSSQLVHVKFFTAPALAKFSRLGQVSVTAQKHYHRALECKNPETITIVLGEHSDEADYLPSYFEGQNPDKDKTSHVWKLVEKKTDVNLAMAMYRDASKGLAEHLVLCSNDSDAEPVLEAIREDFPTLQVGLITPRHPPDEKTGRVVSKSLSNLSNWTRSHINDNELQAAQLPITVTSPKGKVFRKPEHWCRPPQQ